MTFTRALPHHLPFDLDEAKVGGDAFEVLHAPVVLDAEVHPPCKVGVGRVVGADETRDERTDGRACGGKRLHRVGEVFQDPQQNRGGVGLVKPKRRIKVEVDVVRVHGAKVVPGVGRGRRKVRPKHLHSAPEVRHVRGTVDHRRREPAPVVHPRFLRLRPHPPVEDPWVRRGASPPRWHAPPFGVPRLTGPVHEGHLLAW